MKQDRQAYGSGSDFEKSYGYARAVRVGDWVLVSGCTAMGPDGAVGGSDVAAQAEEALRRIVGAVVAAGGSASDIVRTRTFVLDIDSWERVGAVHKRLLHGAVPAATIVEVSRLVHPSLLVEIEADALLGAEEISHLRSVQEIR